MEKPFACLKCKKAFSKKHNLRKHEDIHNDSRPFVCEVNNEHGKIYILYFMWVVVDFCFLFQICGKTFRTILNVQNHIQTHINVGQYTCLVCPYRGNSRQSLSIHKRSHSEHRPYVCRQCPFKCKTPSNLTQHVREVHDKKMLFAVRFSLTWLVSNIWSNVFTHTHLYLVWHMWSSIHQRDRSPAT